MQTFLSLQTFLLFFYPFIILINFIGVKWISFRSKSNKNLPPSPPKIPFIGNFHQLGSSPNHSLRNLSTKYGPIMLLHFGTVPTLVISSSEAAREVLKTHDLSFSSRPNTTIYETLFYGCKDIAFSPYGEYWKRLKSMVVVNLLSNTRVKSFRRVREIEIRRTIVQLEESSGSLVDMGSLLFSLTNNIICMATVGKTCDASNLTGKLKDLMSLFTIFSVGSYVPCLSWVDRLRGLERRAKRVAKEIDELLESIVEEHVNKKKQELRIETEDLVDILLDTQRDNRVDFTFDRDALKAIILDMFVGATDSTSTVLHWTISELMKHPRVLKNLLIELTEIAKGRSWILEEDLEKMIYLKAVLKESLRLHGPAPFLLPHKSTQEVKLNGYDIPADTQVIINSWAIGRDPSLWEEPDEFRPERFLNNSIGYHGFDFEMIPFSAGRRGCPGVQFAAAIMELALANIVYKFDLALPNGAKLEDLDMSERFGITLHKKSPLVVIANPRF